MIALPYVNMIHDCPQRSYYLLIMMMACIVKCSVLWLCCVMMINVRSGYTGYNDRYNWTCNWITHKLTTNYTITTMPLSLPATASLTSHQAWLTPGQSQHYRQRYPHWEYSPHRSSFQWAVSEEKKSRYYLQLLGVLSIIAPIRRY